METNHHGRVSRPVLTQTENNTTLWIGHLQNDSVDHIGGQTFSCPTDGFLDSIQLYAAAVPFPGEVYLTMHEFDPASRSWGPAIGHSALYVQKNNGDKWIRFSLSSLELNKGTTYGFRLYTDKGMIGLGEAAHDTNHPFPFGCEWNASSANKAGEFYSYFSLTFKLEMRA